MTSKEARKAWREANPDKVRAMRKRYKETHKEEIAQKMKEYKARKKEEAKAAKLAEKQNSIVQNPKDENERIPKKAFSDVKRLISGHTKQLRTRRHCGTCIWAWHSDMYHKITGGEIDKNQFYCCNPEAPEGRFHTVVARTEKACLHHDCRCGTK